MRDLLFDAAAMIIGLQTDLAQTEALEAQHGKVIERLTAERDRFRDALENKP